MGQFTNSEGRTVNTETAYIDLDILGSLLAAGTPLAAFADGASATPGIALDDSESVGVRWNNHAAPDAVWTYFRNPVDRRPGTDVTLVLQVSKTGATVGDATTFTVSAFNQVPAALRDADANFGGTSSAITGDAATKTVQTSTLTLASADLSTASGKVSISLKPTDGTLGTDDITIGQAYLTYERVLTPN